MAIHAGNPAPVWAPPIDPARWVDNRVYTDPRAYQLETERIFLRTWLFVCHESELAAPGSFVAATLVGQPVVLVRGNDERIRAFYNTCRHRGSEIVAQKCGQAQSLRCPYHFWVYSLQGELIGIPGEEAYDATPRFRKEDFPLVEVRCETEFGLVFVTFDSSVEPLRAWIGTEIGGVLTKPFANARFEVIRQDTKELPVNWKIFAENARDGYHVPFVHPFFRKASPPGRYELYDNGHAVQYLGMDPAGIDSAILPKLEQHPLPGVGPGDGYIVTLFPDAAFTLRTNVISILSQRALGPDRVAMEQRVLGIAGDSDEVKSIRDFSHTVWFSDPLEREDYPIFQAQQRGVAARGVPYSIIARGVDASSGTRGDDNRLRQWWYRWREMMGVEYNSIAEIEAD